MVDKCPKIIISAENLVWIMYFGDHDDCVQADILMNTHESFDENFGCSHGEAIVRWGGSGLWLSSTNLLIF